MQLPARIGKYELIEFLGGGMSQVYRAQDTVINRTVAVKVLTEQGCADDEVRARFLQEGRTAGGINHENILTVYDFGEEQGRPFMVMEFLRGEDLRQAIKSGSVGDVRNRLRIALSIARALDYIHTLHIVHRDIKPENIHLSTTGAVKLMDFGIAKSADMSMTRTGFLVGTPYYMSPEQVKGIPATAKVDIYSFGILLYELMCGSRPFKGATVEQLFYSILHEAVDMEPLRCEGIPPEVCDIVDRCTAKDPDVRFGSMQEVSAAIAALIGEGPTDAAAKVPTPIATPALSKQPAAVTPIAALPPATNIDKQRRPKWLVPAALAAGFLVIVVLAWYFLRPAKSGDATASKETPAQAIPSAVSDPAGNMVLVPAGSFKFGAAKEPVTLPAFYVDKTEVTNGAYAAFCKATGQAQPDNFEVSRPDLPVVNITIADARAFARWARKRIPSAQEWEKAARGTNGRIYPWGDQPDASRANITADALMPADSMDQGASPYGALHMLGNAWELIDEQVHPSERAVQGFRNAFKLVPPANAQEPWVSIRGGSFSYHGPIANMVVYESSSVPARYHGSAIGFRCVR
jgi:eukaryotic-like serine/threonine-protein kinase